mmetsp:Transcript_24781/g.60878  ORF Transcript_24781/g.60878 Transcript_24781/m.60878 type:complete len:145 (-) Transcript_24781:178-612(-)|eukprot:CAMPEP_0113642834 /NCGR_PEP_ID=MMETSP0017_2-20120614/22505_1 /TAXON_ID=2856 /ORGANISM="Cylindrotheca closterium" /LENGTH=144 /DNA_ID=CAMNT_0000554283 /DNA_START=1749 /DNA_END=2183 /DNA_ORIENTATION=- /assembly_acc=CAM_ASM_000147
MTKQVAFSTCTIQEYPVILGDNPACANGVPITLGWEPVQSSTTEVELHDFMRAKQRRHGKELILPVQDRTQMVMSAGATMEEVADIVLQVDQIRKERAETFNTSDFGEKMQVFQEKLERLPKGIAKNLLKLGRSNKHVVGARSA